MVINQGQDFSAAVLTPDGGLVMQGEEDFPCFITMMSPSTKAIVKECPKESMRPGDVYICNDPYRGGNAQAGCPGCFGPVFWEERNRGVRQQLGAIGRTWEARHREVSRSMPAMRSRKVFASRRSGSRRTMRSWRMSRS